MYLTILILPLLSGIINGLIGRKIGKGGSSIIIKINVTLSTILGIIGFYEIIIRNTGVIIEITKMIETENIEISWNLGIDALTIIIYMPILILSACVQWYSIEYMKEDPHSIRFNSIMSFFTFFMLLLVSGTNWIIIYIGWEGKKRMPEMNQKRELNIKKNINSLKRIGPHNKDILDMIIGSILGDTHLEKRGIGTRIIFEQSNKNVEYIMWYHKYLAERGYCNPKKPRLKIRIEKKNKINYTYRCSSYTFSSLNWLHELFYKEGEKLMPKEIEEYITPLGLAIWFQDKGSKLGEGLKIATNNLKKEEVELLSKIINKKYNLESTIHIGGKPELVAGLSSQSLKGYTIYIKKKDKEKLKTIVKPYILDSMLYKFK